GRDEEVDERTDVFGIGALLYEMLTLRPPFMGTGLQNVLDAARRCVVVAPRGGVAAGSEPPARLCEIVMRALSRDRAARHQTIDELRTDVEGFIRSGGGVAARPLPRGPGLTGGGD